MDYAEHYQTTALDLPGQDFPWLKTFREQAAAGFRQRGFPGLREEEWNYTNLSRLEKQRFKAADGLAVSALAVDLIDRYRLKEASSVVLVDGLFSPEQSMIGDLPEGVVLGSVKDICNRDPDRVESLLHTLSQREQNGFVDFTGAYFRDGFYLDIPEGVTLDRPVQILHVSTQPEGLAVLRHLVTLGRHAAAHLIETWTGDDAADGLNAAVTEIRLAEGACLDHYKLQLEGTRSFHFGGIYVDQAPSACFRQHQIALGGLLARTEIHSRLARQSECELNGLFLASGRQHLDTHTLIHHAEPDAESREHYRGIASERGRGVFSGRILVEKQAQKTAAEMSSRNLLLSEDAEIDCKPQLEIHADDVKCSHGVTVGQLDDESIFYLQSRGISEATARNMLTFAFANEQIEKIGIEAVRGLVREALLHSLPHAAIREDWL